MRILLSIKPEYVDKIFNGSKRFEFRRILFKSDVVDEVYIYETAPVKKIVGSFKIKGVLCDSPAKIWEISKNYSGINKDIFFKYFSGRDIAYAIEIENPVEFHEPIDPLKKFKKFTPPQSFYYVDYDLDVICSGKRDS